FEVNNIVYISPVFGNTEATIATGSHQHPLPTISRAPVSPQAYMSGGTRTLASTTVALPAGKTCLVTACLSFQMRGGDPGPCNYRLNLNINGNVRSSGSGVNG